MFVNEALVDCIRYINKNALQLLSAFENNLVCNYVHNINKSVILFKQDHIFMCLWIKIVDV